MEDGSVIGGWINLPMPLLSNIQACDPPLILIPMKEKKEWAQLKNQVLFSLIEIVSKNNSKKLLYYIIFQLLEPINQHTKGSENGNLIQNTLNEGNRITFQSHN